MNIKPTSAPLSALKASVAMLIFFSITLPSGTFYGIPFKHASYLFCIATLLYAWGNNKNKIDNYIIALFVTVSAFTVFYALVGILQGTASIGYILLEGTGLFTALTIVLILLAAHALGAADEEDFVRFAFYGVFAFASWKTAVVLLLVLKVISYQQVYLFFIDHVGYRPVTSGIFGGLVRFNLIIYDFIVAFFLFLVPAYPNLFRKIPIYIRHLFMAVGTACLVFAFSRLLFALVAILWGYAYFFKASFKAKLIIAGLAIAISSATLPWFVGAIDQRFSTIQTSKSDDIRFEQVEALVDVWLESPFIGGGFGYYSKNLIRDPNVPFSYEVQWIGFLAKLGILGIGFLTILVGFLYFGMLAGSRTLDHYVFAFVLSCFILGGFTNQYLVSSASGVFYATCLFVAWAVRKNVIKSSGLR